MKSSTIKCQCDLIGSGCPNPDCRKQYERKLMTPVFVISWVLFTIETKEQSSGGFDWYPQDLNEVDPLTAFENEVNGWKTVDEPVRVRLVKMTVPESVPAKITEYIDNNLDDVEVNLPAIADWSQGL